MSVGSRVRRAWQRFAMIAHAMDQDESTELAARHARLEAAVRQHASDLATLSERVESLAADLSVLSRQDGSS